MSTEEARNYVESRLQQRSIARQEREREEQLDDFEQKMISFCNQHSADAKKNREKQEKCENHRALKEEKREAMRRKDEAAQLACTKYGYACVAILLLSAWTPIPLYAAIALIAGLSVFPAVYIVKLYGLLEEKDA